MDSRPKVDYKSAFLDVNYFGVQGTLYKKIENLKIFHDAMFHYKFVVINFKESQIHFYNSNKDTENS